MRTVIVPSKPPGLLTVRHFGIRHLPVRQDLACELDSARISASVLNVDSVTDRDFVTTGRVVVVQRRLFSFCAMHRLLGCRFD